MTRFVDVTPTPETDWRAVVLFGRNVASYKFALGRALLELADREATFVPLTDLAEPFSRHLCSHLDRVAKQGTSAKSEFLDACRIHNQGVISKDELVAITVKRGFNNVIDAFHMVGQGNVATRFFTDDRKARIKGITVTDQLLALKETYQWQNLPDEVEARWRLVETAWSLNLSPSLIQVEHDPETDLLSISARLRRIAITSCRDALNGYQKGRCFYCFRNVSILAGSPDLTDVDHFFPHTLKLAGVQNLDGVWNLVLACRECNRGSAGKFAQVPGLEYMERLDRRNNYLINSHHPLRETIMNQTGATEEERVRFLQRIYIEAASLLPSQWSPANVFEGAF